MKTLIFAVCLIILINFMTLFTEQKESQVQPATKISTPKIEYELDLTERCKDWIYFRDKAYRLAHEGDNEGAIKAGKMMRRFYDDLKLHFTPDEISKELSRLEEERIN